MYVFSENGETAGPNRLTNKEFYKKLSHQLTETLSAYTPDGLCYRVDLRLRPEGRYGELCISVEAARQYQNNVQVLQTAKTLTLDTLRLEK